ncbi:MAG: hypothetical protein Q9183_005678 [Haloplaca sp. 2 TL-2023]
MSSTRASWDTVAADRRKKIHDKNLEGDDSTWHQPLNTKGVHSTSEMDEDDMIREFGEFYVISTDGTHLVKTFYWTARKATMPQYGLWDNLDKLERLLKWGISDGFPEVGYKVPARSSPHKDGLPNFDIETDTDDDEKMGPLQMPILGHRLALRIMKLRLANHVAKLDKRLAGGQSSPVDNSVQFAIDQTRDLEKKSVEWYIEMAKLSGEWGFDYPH